MLPLICVIEALFNAALDGEFVRGVEPIDSHLLAIHVFRDVVYVLRNAVDGRSVVQDIVNIDEYLFWKVLSLHSSPID
jgi:hypothetical protein